MIVSERKRVGSLEDSISHLTSLLEERQQALTRIGGGDIMIERNMLKAANKEL